MSTLLDSAGAWTRTAQWTPGCGVDMVDAIVAGDAVLALRAADPPDVHAMPPHDHACIQPDSATQNPGTTGRRPWRAGAGLA